MSYGSGMNNMEKVEAEENHLSASDLVGHLSKLLLMAKPILE